MGNLDHPVSFLPDPSQPFLTCDSIWNGLATVGIAVLYFPKSQTRIKGEHAKAILAKIDYVGAFLSITGLTLL